MSFKKHIQAFLSHDAHPFVQFIKYGIAGGAATGVNILIFFLAGFLLFPCVGQDDILVRLFNLSVPAVEQAVRAKNAVYCTIIAFLISNAICYWMNRLFVFKPGRHHVVLEFMLFFGVSAISAFVGTALVGILIGKFGIQTTYAFGANIIASLAINYVMRKYVVFKG